MTAAAALSDREITVIHRFDLRHSDPSDIVLNHALALQILAIPSVVNPAVLQSIVEVRIEQDTWRNVIDVAKQRLAID